MRLVVFGLVCFWSGLTALIARLCGLPVLPLTVLIGAFSAMVLILVCSLCQAAGTEFPEDRPIDIQTYFGGTFRMRKSTGGMNFLH